MCLTALHTFAMRAAENSLTDLDLKLYSCHRFAGMISADKDITADKDISAVRMLYYAAHMTACDHVFRVGLELKLDLVYIRPFHNLPPQRLFNCLLRCC